MPFDGSGNYVPAAAPNFPAIGGAVISSIYYNATINDIVAALNNCVTRDGQGKPSAAISWNGQNLSGINNLTATNLTVTNAPTLAGLTATAVINANAGVLAGAGTFDGITANFSAQATGHVGYHMYNGGGVCEWLTRQPIHSTTDDYRISTVVAGVVTDRFMISPAGVVTIPGTFNVGGSIMTVNTNLLIQYNGTDGFIRTQSGILNLGAGGNNWVTISPTGVVAAPTPSAGDNSTTVATTAFVQTAKALGIQTVTSAGTVTPAFPNDMVIISAQAAGLTLANPSGAFTEGWGLVVRVNDNGSPQTIAFGAAYRGIGVALPTTTVAGKTLYIGMILNNAAGKWDVITVAQG